MSRYSQQEVQSIKNEKIKKEKPKPKKVYTSKDLESTKSIYTGRGKL